MDDDLKEDKEKQDYELEALQSIFDDPRLFVRSSTGNGGQLSVTVNLPDDLVIQYSRKSKKECVEEERPAAKDEKDAYTKLEIKHLPPIVLNFDLPPSYPSKDMPIYTLSCKWLDPEQISKLCFALDKHYEEHGGNEILFEWKTLLSEDTFQIIGLSKQLVLRVDRNASHTDKRAVQDVFSLDGLITSLIDYNQLEEKRQFDMDYINCGVCFLEKFGSLCIQFSPCKHAFCKECMTEYFTVHIKDGSVKALVCPEDKCEVQADPGMVRSLVDKSLFERYDKLLLERTLECMSDIIFCPRKVCQSPVLKDNDLDLGRCANCGFNFCILCNNTYHGRGKCPLSSKEMLELREIYLNGTEEEKAELVQKYGQARMHKIIEEGYSEAWMEKFAKKCPNCKASIQKIDGCNKMTCFQCRRNFCWLCNIILSNVDPYKHFSDDKKSCYNKLFEGVDQDAWLENEDEDGWIYFV